MQKFSDLVERFALAVLLIGGAGMVTAMFLGAGDVVGTQFFGWPIPGVLEITESTMTLIVFGALAYAQIRRNHIRVELIYSHMGPRTRAAMDVAANVAAIIFFGFLLSEAIAEGMTSWRIRETADGLIQFPLYPARWILISGTVMLLLQLGLHTIQDLGRVSSGEELEERDDLPPIPGLPDLPDPNSFDRKP
ncbi:MAG: TRAP transporter small permease [Rhodospirillaceae bacterium]|jgi:TRAP-type C4-dicarboxylate transport system permease small subunit|nr:TRAP transporter small permease [Rhodospirillaceae bacterium]MBT4042019.1 TRAP transporter small permease [Rhodospirillaceae bacterium]MBT4690333.1 TRAP transporter small permease [Rhodospirillaceae bacterium]MBT5079307.1 TRAP transporter small permease [Rhodospirillaceae bacterium]MBT5525783.1 TRAP transporter small permease [Rhodospirillaceae bacterium]